MATSDTQMLLANDPGFQARLQYVMQQQARTVLAETSVGATHPARANYAKLVISYPSEYANKAAPMIVGGTNLLPPNATTTVNADGTVTTDCTDASLLSQVATFWNALAGIDSGN